MLSCLSKNALLWAVLFVVIGAPVNTKLIWTIVSGIIIAVMWPVNFQEFILLFFKEKICLTASDQNEQVCDQPGAKLTNDTASEDVNNGNKNHKSYKIDNADHWKKNEILVLCTALLSSSAVGFLDWQTVIPTWPLPTLVVFTITRLILYALERYQ